MHIFTRAAGCVTLWFFVVACTDGASPSSTGGGAGAVSTSSGGGDAAVAVVDRFCDAIVPLFCQTHFACCPLPNPELDYTFYADYCPQKFFSGGHDLCGHGFSRTWLEASLRAGTTVFDEAQFDTCVALLKAMSAGGEACTEPTRYVFTTTCQSAFRGQTAPGGACPIKGELWQGLWPINFLTCKDGICENSQCSPYLKIGDACEIGRLGAPASASCNYFNHEECFGTPNTGPGLTGTCGPQGEIGDACHPGNDRECRSLKCDATGKCISAAMHTTCDGI